MQNDYSGIIVRFPPNIDLFSIAQCTVIAQKLQAISKSFPLLVAIEQKIATTIDVAMESNMEKNQRTKPIKKNNQRV